METTTAIIVTTLTATASTSSMASFRTKRLGTVREPLIRRRQLELGQLTVIKQMTLPTFAVRCRRREHSKHQKHREHSCSCLKRNARRTTRLLVAHHGMQEEKQPTTTRNCRNLVSWSHFGVHLEKYVRSSLCFAAFTAVFYI